MTHPVLALGTAAVTAAGSAWYLPALLDLRAGDDRPHATRLAALACLTWWAGPAVAAVLLATDAAWQPPVAAVLVGAVAGALLRSAAAAARRAERREAAACWEAVGHRPRPAAGSVRPRPAVPAWLATGTAVSTVVITASVLLAPHGAPALVAGLCASVGVGLLTVLAAIRRARP